MFLNITLWSSMSIVSLQKIVLTHQNLGLEILDLIELHRVASF